MAWVIAIISFALLWLLSKRKKGVRWWMKAALAFIGGASLADTGLGAWIAARLGDIARLIPGAGLALIGGVALILIVIVIYDIGVDKKADKPALGCLIVLPLLFLAGVGPLAETGATITEAIAAVGTNSLQQLIGG